MPVNLALGNSVSFEASLVYAANFRLARAIYSKTLSPTKTKQNKDRLSPPSIVQAFQEVSPPSEQLLINTRGRMHVVPPLKCQLPFLSSGFTGQAWPSDEHKCIY